MMHYGKVRSPNCERIYLLCEKREKSTSEETQQRNDFSMRCSMMSLLKIIFRIKTLASKIITSLTLDSIIYVTRMVIKQ